jgi:hypothetical protein
MSHATLDALGAASLEDLRADFAELAAIATSVRARLARSLVELDRAGLHLQRATRREIARDRASRARRDGPLRCATSQLAAAAAAGGDRAPSSALLRP